MLIRIQRHFDPALQCQDPFNCPKVIHKGQYYYVCLGNSTDSAALYITKEDESTSITRPDDLRNKWEPVSGMHINYFPDHYAQRREEIAALKLLAVKPAL
jgi:hypothetical protein